MRKLSPVIIFLLLYAVFITLCAVFAEPGSSVDTYYEGWNLAGDYTPSDDELGIADPEFYAPPDSINGPEAFER